MMQFYRVHQPDFANPKKVQEVLDFYFARALRRQGGAIRDGYADWREEIRQSHLQQRGRDPWDSIPQVLT